MLLGQDGGGLQVGGLLGQDGGGLQVGGLLGGLQVGGDGSQAEGRLGQDSQRGRLPGSSGRGAGGLQVGGDDSQAEGRAVELGQDSQRGLVRRYLVEVLGLWTIGPNMVHLGHKMRIAALASRPRVARFSDGNETRCYLQADAST